MEVVLLDSFDWENEQLVAPLAIVQVADLLLLHLPVVLAPTGPDRVTVAVQVLRPSS